MQYQLLSTCVPCVCKLKKYNLISTLKRYNLQEGYNGTLYPVCCNHNAGKCKLRWLSWLKAFKSCFCFRGVIVAIVAIELLPELWHQPLVEQPSIRMEALLPEVGQPLQEMLRSMNLSSSIPSENSIEMPSVGHTTIHDVLLPPNIGRDFC
jgi:hypothetical protein